MAIIAGEPVWLLSFCILRKSTERNMLRHTRKLLPVMFLLSFLATSGCALFPEIAYQPTFHNPFPQLSTVAIVPFFNFTNNQTLNTIQFSEAYGTELQKIPGFTVVPVSLVQKHIEANHTQLNSPEDMQKLARDLGVDAVVLGVITDYDSWYPPRIGLQTQWYAANPGYHPIPPGYGLPWGTPDEQDIPGPVVFEAEMALAKAQLDTQVPACGDQSNKAPEPPAELAAEVSEGKSQMAASGLPADWPDSRGFIPPPPQQKAPTCWPSGKAVIEHTANYVGNDMELTEALESYYFFQDDARFGGWQSYLNRSEDFIRFCCYMHIAQTLSTRGGVSETRAVWRWQNPN